MFQVGANNPNVGNDRRKQLLNALAQQLAQRHQAGQVGADQLGGQFLQRKKQQNPFVTAATRGVGAGRNTAGTSLIQGGNIPDSVAGHLGVGGFSRPPAPPTAHTIPSIFQPNPAGAPSGSIPSVPGSGSGTAPNAPSAGGGVISPGSPVGVGGDLGGGGAALGGSPLLGKLIPLGNGVFIDPQSGQVFGGSGSTAPMGSLASHLNFGRDAGGY